MKIKLMRISSLYFSLLLLFPSIVYSQKTYVVDSTNPDHRTVVAGKEYKASAIYQMFWGNHYRKEWTTPVVVPIINLDTIAGGLVPIEEGGTDTKTLHLVNKYGKQYVLRNVDKDYGRALPGIAEGTFIQDVAKDQVSTTHPFAAVTVPQMAATAKVFHSDPIIGFVPYTESMGVYNKDFANTLCLLEQRDREDKENVTGFGKAANVVGTERMFDRIFNRNNHKVDQVAFVRARLFDIFVGDWGRSEVQWRWARFDSTDQSIYRPIPHNRDQTYAKFDGFFPYWFTTPEQLEHLKSFNGKIKNIKKYNYYARYLDRRLTNEVPRQTWIDLAKELQQSLTDSIISNAVHQMPPELFAISGNTIIEKLKTRRKDLVNYADKYYRFLSKEVDVVGTRQDELFEIKRLNNEETQISLFALNNKGEPKDKPFYSRIFRTDETHEVRLYGLGGNDIYHIEGSASKGIKLRIIGGPDKDSLTNTSSTTRGKQIYYDNPGNTISGSIKTHLSTDTAINEYDYKAFNYNTGHTVKSAYYSNTRGIYLMAGYTYTRQGFRKEPFSWSQKLIGIYSIFNNSFGAEYSGIFNHVIGKWNLALLGRYDAIATNYYFGTGNESLKTTSNINYYRLRTREGLGSVGLNRNFGRYNFFSISGMYQTVKVLKDSGHYFFQAIPPDDGSAFEARHFAGIEGSYSFYHVNDNVLPTKGIGLTLLANHTFNLDESSKSFNRYLATFGFYLPISNAFTLAVKTGGTTVTGSPEFYQLSWLGGGQNLRGFHRQRFYGKTAFFDQNELRWVFNTRNYIFNGKMGLIAFLDDGRVWQPDENSSKWHFGYGVGFMIVPFNIISATAYYGMSQDGGVIHFKLGKFF